MKYIVYWSKAYIMHGREEIEAKDEEEAKRIGHEGIGDYQGLMQYDAYGDEVIIGER